MPCTSMPQGVTTGVTFFRNPRTEAEGLDTKMVYNRSTRNSPAAVTYCKMTKDTVYRQALHPFAASTLPANLLGHDAAPKNLIEFTCANEKPA